MTSGGTGEIASSKISQKPPAAAASPAHTPQSNPTHLGPVQEEANHEDRGPLHPAEAGGGGCKGHEAGRNAQRVGNDHLGAGDTVEGTRVRMPQLRESERGRHSRGIRARQQATSGMPCGRQLSSKGLATNKRKLSTLPVCMPYLNALSHIATLALGPVDQDI